MILNQKLLEECNEMKVGQQTETKVWRPNISAASFEPSGQQRAHGQYFQEKVPGMVTGLHRVGMNRPNIFQSVQQPMVYEHVGKQQRSSVYSQFGNHIMETTFFPQPHFGVPASKSQKNRSVGVYECCICLEETSDKRKLAVLVPCGHTVCEECSSKMPGQPCPTCRRQCTYSVTVQGIYEWKPTYLKFKFWTRYRLRFPKINTWCRQNFKKYR